MSVRIVHGDCLEELRKLPAASVHCCVTSPPYWGLRDYGVAGQIGLESTPLDYVEKMVAVFREARRVLRDDGTLWLNLGDSYAGSGRGGYAGNKSGLDGSVDGQDKSRIARGSQLAAGLHESACEAGAIGRAWIPPPNGLKQKNLVGIPWRVAFALQADGWYLRQDIIWHKPNPMPESVRDRCTKAHEYIFLLAKSERYYYDADAIAEAVVGDPEASRNRWDTKDYDVPGQKPQKRLTRGKHSTQAPQSSGHRIVENVARARAAGADHDSPFGDTRNKRSVWTVTTKAYADAHFATFPPDLIEPCILAGCPRGGVVLDCFGGAGTTGLVADRLQRDAILIELNPEYAAMANRRITADSPMFSQVGA
jgi:DNA modification methylase